MARYRVKHNLGTNAYYAQVWCWYWPFWTMLSNNGGGYRVYNTEQEAWNAIELVRNPPKSKGVEYYYNLHSTKGPK